MPCPAPAQPLPSHSRPRRRRAAVLALAVAGGAALAAGCSSSPERGPRPSAVVPDRGSLAVPVTVRIRGRDAFPSRVTYSDPSEGGVDAGYQAILGSVALEDVSVLADGALTATVPAGLAAGVYDLTVVDPWGRPGTLPGAYRVLEATDGGGFVTRFRVDPVGPQVAFRPFTASIAAVDGDGAVVTEFNGAVRLSDSTGTVVPATATRFVAGRWTGLVELRAPHAADVLTAQGDQGAAGTSTPFAVAAPAVAAARFSTAPASTLAGRCTGPITLVLRDAFGTPVQADRATALVLAPSPSQGFALYGDAGCTAPLGAPVVPPGRSDVSVWFVATRAGAVDLQATGTGLAAAVQRHAVQPGPPAALAFVTAPQAVTAGACSQAATVEVRDAFGNPSPAAGLALALETSPAGRLSFFTGPSCTGAAPALALGGAATRADLYFSATDAGPATVTVSGAGVGAASQDVLVTAQGRASRLAFLTPPRSAAAGDCSEEVSIQAQDSFGNAVATAGAVQVSLSAEPASGVLFYADAACSAPVTSVQIGAAQSTGGFRFRGVRAGGLTVTASATTLTAATQPATVRPAPPSQVAFASAAQRRAAGGCSAAAALEVRDAFGNPAPVGAPVEVGLSAAPPDGFGFYSDAACTAAITAVTVATAASAAGFHFEGTRAGPVVVQAAPSGLGGDAQTEQIGPAAAARLAFTSAPQSLSAGACSGAATLEVRDTFGNVATLPGGAMVSLAAAPAAGVTFYRDAACTAPVPAASVPAGGSAASFFFTATRPGKVTVTATAPGVDPDAQVETVTAALPRQLAFATPPQTVAAGECSGAVTVESRDAFGNPSAVSSAATVDLAAAPAPGIAFFAGEGCTGAAASTVSLAAGASAVTFSFRSTAAGQVTLTAAATGLGSAAQVEAVTPLAPDHLAFASAAQTQRVGDCSAAVAVRTEDVHGNPSAVAAATSVDLTVSPGGGLAFYSDAACTVPVTAAAIPAGGQSATFHFKGSSAGSFPITAAAAGLRAASQTEEIVEALPQHLVFASAAQVVIAGNCSTPVGLEAVNAGGAAAPVSTAIAVALSASPGAGVTFYAGTGCAGAAVTSVTMASGASTATFSFRATASGTLTIGASAPGMAPSPAQDETIVAAAPDHLVFTSAPQTVTAGLCSAAVVLGARDPSGNVARVTDAAAVTLAASAGGVTFHDGPGCTGSAVTSISLATGASAATFSFRATASGTVTVTAAAQGLSPSPTQTETVVAAGASVLAFTSAAQTVAAGFCSEPVSLQVRDGAGNPTPVSGSTTVSLTASTAGVTFHEGSGCGGAAVSSVSIAGGGSAATFSFRATAAGPLTLTASAAGMSPSPTQDETVVAAAADHLVFTTAAQTLAAGACSTPVGLGLRDAHGNAAPAVAELSIGLSADPPAGVSLHAGAGCSGSAVSSLSLPAGASAATFSFRATASGTVTLTASAANLSPSPTQAEVIGAGGADHFTWGSIASPQPAGVPFPVTVTARDATGNVATSFADTATLSVSAGSVSCDSSCTSGSVTGRFTAGVWTGSVAVSPKGTAVTLRAASGSASGTSAAFDLSGPATRSPPTARLSARPTVIVSGNDVVLDASASSDYQTAAGQLSVSWSTQATGASMTGAGVPAAPPWTAWTTAKTLTHAYTNNGSAPVMYQPRVAVRDTETGAGGPDVGYASATVVVLPDGDGRCVVDTASDVDDGASSCHATGSDGKLSLREAIRIANASPKVVAISFSGAMTIAARGTLTISRPVYIVAQPGVALDTATLSIASSGVVIAGLELSRQASPVVVEKTGDVLLRDLYLHDGAGLVVRGRAHVDRLRMSACAGTCLTVDDAGAHLALFGSELEGSRTNTGLALQSCASGGWSSSALSAPDAAYNGPVLVTGTVFSEFATAIQSSCGVAVVANDTFTRNGTGVSGAGLALMDSIFTGHTTAAVSAPSCPGFVSSSRHLVWQNASDGCLASEVSSEAGPSVTFAADPLFAFPASGDHRLQHGSPAKDSASSSTNIDVDGPGPGRFLGADADRGGRETY